MKQIALILVFLASILNTQAQSDRKIYKMYGDSIKIVKKEISANQKKIEGSIVGLLSSFCETQEWDLEKDILFANLRKNLVEKVELQKRYNNIVLLQAEQTGKYGEEIPQDSLSNLVVQNIGLQYIMQELKSFKLRIEQ